MSTNCLVTKFKGTVDNDSLEVFDAFKINVAASQSPTIKRRRLSITGNKALTATIIDGNANFVQDDLTTVIGKEVTSTVIYVCVSNDPCTILVKGRYNITAFGVDMDAYTTFSIPGLSDIIKWNKDVFIASRVSSPDTLDLSLFEDNVVLNGLHNEKCVGDIGNVASPELLILRAINRSDSSAVYGNITDLIPCTKIINIYTNVYATINGELNDFAAGQVAAGRTSGTINFDFFGNKGNLTLDGTRVSGQATITYNSSLEQGYSITLRT